MATIFRECVLEETNPAHIKELEIDWVEWLKEEFYEARLCDRIGHQIVAEYGFKGRKEAVWKQLEEYNDMINELDEFSPEFISELIVRKQKYLEHKAGADHAKKAIVEAIKSNDIGKMVDSSMGIMYGNQQLHDMESCLCFNND